jgi:LacI family transcriptional regulator
MDRIPSNWRGDSVTSAHEQGAYLATRHLIDLGHVKIATITGPLTLSSATARLAGYRRAMKEAGLPVTPEYVQEAEFNTTAGFNAARKLVALRRKPTAVFAANDLIGFGVLAALREAGLHCPQDISVVGFDNLDESNVASPKLSTIEQFAYQVGAKAAEIVIERNQGDDGAAKHVVLTPKLLVKDSTGRAVKRQHARRKPATARKIFAAI